MRFYTKAHAYYCGIDLHARWMYLCVLDQQGEVLLHRNLRACPEAFLKAIEPFARIWSSPSSASSPGIGWPTSAPNKASSSS